MAFSSDTFLFLLLPVTLGIYYLLRPGWRNVFLLAASLLFFSWTRPDNIWILLSFIVLNYILGLLIGNHLKGRIRKICFILGIICNLLPLFYYKYFNFGVNILNSITKSGIAGRDLIMPVGISFYTFTDISYIADVYRNKTDAEKDPLNLALYVSFFPKLIEGPITRYDQMNADLKERHISSEDFVYGTERFIVGLFRKVIIADTLGKSVDAIWKVGVSQNTTAIAWLGAVAYTLQIYFDFAGYSDMAIGTARMFGFHLPENFNLPYISKSISEFWRRWHITLGSWFRDYVYIPLGGNRKGAFRTYLNLAVVFFLTGLWHGAAYHYVLWGLFNGFFMLVERYLRIHQVKVTLISERVTGVFQTLYALFITNLAWVLFRAPDIHLALAYMKTMFGIGMGTQPGFKVAWYLDGWTVLILILAILCSTSVPSHIYRKFNEKNSVLKTFVKYAGLLVLLYLSMIKMVSGTSSSFIYFQF